MNCLFGKIFLDSPRNNPSIKENNIFANENLHLYVSRLNIFNFDSKTYFFNPNTLILSVILGYIDNLEHLKAKHNINKESDVEIVESLYSLIKLRSVAGVVRIYSWGGIYTYIFFGGGRGRG